MGAEAVVVADYGEADFGTAPAMNAVVFGNVLQNSYFCVGAEYPCQDYSVIFSGSLTSIAISQNTIMAGGSPGVYVYGGPGQVSGNTITGAYNGVWLDTATSRLQGFLQSDCFSRLPIPFI